MEIPEKEEVAERIREEVDGGFEELRVWGAGE